MLRTIHVSIVSCGVFDLFSGGGGGGDFSRGQKSAEVDGRRRRKKVEAKKRSIRRRRRRMKKGERRGRRKKKKKQFINCVNVFHTNSTQFDAIYAPRYVFSWIVAEYLVTLIRMLRFETYTLYSTNP